MNKLDEIDDEVTLQKMLTATKDLDERKLIRARLLAVKGAKSKEREAQLASLEKRREEEIQERKARKEAEQLATMKRFEDMSKQSTSERMATFSEKCNQDMLKERLKVSEDGKKKTLEKFDAMAKSHESAKEKNDSVEQQLIKQKLDWANEDKARELERAKTTTATQLPAKK